MRSSRSFLPGPIHCLPIHSALPMSSPTGWRPLRPPSPVAPSIPPRRSPLPPSGWPVWMAVRRVCASACTRRTRSVPRGRAGVARESRRPRTPANQARPVSPRLSRRRTPHSLAGRACSRPSKRATFTAASALGSSYTGLRVNTSGSQYGIEVISSTTDSIRGASARSRWGVVRPRSRSCAAAAWPVWF